MYKEIFYDEIDPQYVTTRIIRNKNYGGLPCEVPGTCIVPIKNKGIKPRTRQAIQDSIKETGCHNPILVYKTRQGIHLAFGGGRLLACQNLDQLVPAIIVNYTDSRLDGRRGLKVTPENWKQYFEDVPAHFEFTEYGIETHYGLERGRDDWFDPAGTAWADDLDDNSFLVDESPWL